jgi:hypothetical protein
VTGATGGVIVPGLSQALLPTIATSFYLLSRCSLLSGLTTLMPSKLRSNGPAETFVCQCDYEKHLADAPGSTVEPMPPLLRQTDQEITWRIRQVTPYPHETASIVWSNASTQHHFSLSIQTGRVAHLPPLKTARWNFRVYLSIRLLPLE